MTRSVCACNNSLFLNALDGISFIAFSFSMMFTSITEDAWRNLSCMYRSCIRGAAAMEVDFIPLYDHDTAEVLT